jgi:hypothetical protein
MERGRKYRAFRVKIDDWLLPWEPFFQRLAEDHEAYQGISSCPSVDYKNPLNNDISEQDSADISRHIIEKLNPEDVSVKFEHACALYFGSKSAQ